ncbi:Puromycin-sensitive aminopeptidase [Nymphon striatum]|nr:Puromycin-sensitive aminopeptidase [Nymphon striatum]
MVSATFERLPENVLPKEYNITIKPNLNTFKFNGQVKIECLVTEATSEISFNVADMEISNYMYVAEIAAENVLMLSKDEKATAKFSSPLPLGKGYLSMDFIGSLNDQMKGLYRSKYVINGEERYAAVSQFEPTDARRAFPCWDEPAIKAVFNITLIVPKDRVALSNMNVKFAPSPIMSTYLVAIVVGEYDYIEDTSEDGVLVRVYTPVVKQNKADFLFRFFYFKYILISIFYLLCTTWWFYLVYYQYFEKYVISYYGYPLPKLDLIAIADFAAGAMENWGVAIVVAHELAHQWFGNLVTMVCTLYFKEWWTHLWLNEGFATFMEFLCVDNVPDLKNSHPIEVPVGSPSEIDEIFDTISYNKGASVIRMLHNFIGDKVSSVQLILFIVASNSFNQQLYTTNFNSSWLKSLFSVPFSISVKHKNWNDEVNNNHDLCLWMDAHSQSVIQKDSGYVMVSYMRKYCNIVAKKDPCKKTVVLNFSEHVFYTKTITMHCEACKQLTISPVDEISTSKNYYWQDNSKSFCFNSRPSTLCLINTTRNFFTNLLSCSEVHWPNIRSIT